MTRETTGASTPAECPVCGGTRFKKVRADLAALRLAGIPTEGLDLQVDECGDCGWRPGDLASSRRIEQSREAARGPKVSVKNKTGQGRHTPSKDDVIRPAVPKIKPVTPIRKPSI